MMLTPAFSQFAHLGAGVFRAFDAPAESFGAGIRLVLDEWTRDVEGRAGNLAAIDPVAHFNAFFQRRAQIARAGHASQQELPRGRRHDFGAEAGRVGFVPVLVVTVAEQHRVHVRVPESGQHVHALGGDYFGVRRDGQFAHLANRLDPGALDQDDAVGERRPAESVDQSPADQGDGRGAGGAGGNKEGEREKPDERPNHGGIIRKAGGQEKN